MKNKISPVIALTLIVACSLIFTVPTIAADSSIPTSSGGNHHNAFIKTDGSLWTCGNNTHGQLGDGTTINRYTPVKVMDNVASVSVNAYHTLAIKKDDSLWAWGYNAWGLFGDDEKILTPVKIMDDVAAVSAGYTHVFVIKTDGSLLSWGVNDCGQLGDDTTTGRSSPLKIMDDVVAVSSTYMHVMAIKKDGSLWAWGGNGFGKLGDGTRTDRHTPFKVMDDVAAVSVGNQHTAVLKKDGSLWTWGGNYSGQLGDGTDIDRELPTKVMDYVVAVSANGNNTAVIKTDGSLWYWGIDLRIENDESMIFGRNNPVKLMDKAVALSVDDYHITAIKEDNSLWTWGVNYDGQLGDGTTTNRLVSVKVMDDVTTIANTMFCIWDGSVFRPSALPGLSEWAIFEVNALNIRDIIPDALKDNFQQPIRRDEFMALLVELFESSINLESINPESPFSDISNTPYKTAIEAAYSYDLINGTSPTQFSPEGLLTREQIAKLLCTLVAKIENFSTTPKGAPYYKDSAIISDWAIPYVAYSQENNIMMGNSNGNFDPKGNFTREQALLVIERLIVQYGW